MLENLRKAEEQKPFNIRDSDLRSILERIADGKKISYGTHTPYSSGHEATYRLYDKTYFLDGLKILVEFELGRKLGYTSRSGVTYIVTPQEQVMYEEKKEKVKIELEKKVKVVKRPGRHDAIRLPGILISGNYGPSFITGVIVDNTEDIELTTAKVKSVLAQYDELDLNRLVDLEWRKFIEAVKDKYGVEIGSPSDGIIKKVATHCRGGVIIETKILINKPQVFRLLISEEANLENGINSVYSAGLTVKKAVDKTVNHLIETYL